jgi:hypothetical protein
MNGMAIFEQNYEDSRRVNGKQDLLMLAPGGSAASFLSAQWRI